MISIRIGGSRGTGLRDRDLMFVSGVRRRRRSSKRNPTTGSTGTRTYAIPRILPRPADHGWRCALYYRSPSCGHQRSGPRWSLPAALCFDTRFLANLDALFDCIPALVGTRTALTSSRHVSRRSTGSAKPSRQGRTHRTSKFASGCSPASTSIWATVICREARAGQVQNLTLGRAKGMDQNWPEHPLRRAQESVSHLCLLCLR